MYGETPPRRVGAELVDRLQRFNAALQSGEADMPRTAAASGGGEQPRGWLTEDQKDAVRTAREHLSVGLIGTEENSGWYKVHRRRVDALNALLARSTPPEVVLPNVYDHIGLRPVYLRADVIAALAAAGVEVAQ